MSRIVTLFTVPVLLLIFFFALFFHAHQNALNRFLAWQDRMLAQQALSVSSTQNHTSSGFFSMCHTPNMRLKAILITIVCPPARKPLLRVRKPNLRSDRGQDSNPCAWRTLGPQSTHGSTVPRRSRFATLFYVVMSRRKV
ncbi:hypothetical protein E2C01_092790 [Portunus trituberculatus]|uniref:Uncharacterized protein n=1 Tax=Portunus trituberculatus TaxID=210409 RepID=A0A5B7JSU0_PORTR|nr:hypothetical protein [Portunus trituberculatus]